MIFGIEIAAKYARFAAARLAKLGVPNAAVVHGDALRFFAEVLPDASVSAVHIYFPDPWWKKRHLKRRIIRPSFVADVFRTLEPGGCFTFGQMFSNISRKAAPYCGMGDCKSSRGGPRFVPRPTSRRNHAGGRATARLSNPLRKADAAGSGSCLQSCLSSAGQYIGCQAAAERRFRELRSHSGSGCPSYHVGVLFRLRPLRTDVSLHAAPKDGDRAASAESPHATDHRQSRSPVLSRSAG